MSRLREESLGGHLRKHRSEQNNKSDQSHKNLKGDHSHNNPKSDQSHKDLKRDQSHKDLKRDQGHKNPKSDQNVSHKDLKRDQSHKDLKIDQRHKNPNSDQSHKNPKSDQSHKDLKRDQSHKDLKRDQSHKDLKRDQSHKNPKSDQSHKNLKSDQSHKNLKREDIEDSGNAQPKKGTLLMPFKVDQAECQRGKRKYKDKDTKRMRTDPKGKDYSTQSDRDVVDRRNPPEVLQRNLECDSKKGGRNRKTAFSLRKCDKIGSDVFQPRNDRARNADCSGWAYSDFVEKMNQEWNPENF